MTYATERDGRELFFDRLSAERIPATEWAWYWQVTTERWIGEGLPKDGGDDAIKDFFGLENAFNLYMISPHNAGATPALHDEGIVKNEAEYDSYLPNLYADRIFEARIEDLQGLRKRRREKGVGVGIVLLGAFWWPRELFGMEHFLYALYDHPALIRRMIGDVLAFNLGVVKKINTIFTPDFYVISEDMCYKNGSIVSPSYRDEFMKDYYRDLLPAMHRNGSRVFVDTDGFCEDLIPWFLEMGVDGIAPCERMAGNDPVRIMANHPGLYLIGGFDKTKMVEDEDVVRAEFEKILPAIKSGRYIPTCDHQVPPSVSLKAYKTYCALLREFTAMAE